MGRFFNLMRFYRRRLITSRFYIGLFIFFTILFLTRFYFRITDQFGRADYGNLIGEMMIVVHALFLGYMVYFYKLFSDELKYGVHSFFADSSLIIMQKIGAITLVHAFFQFLYYTFTAILLVLFYTVIGIPITYFYVDSAFFMMINYAAPMLIAQLIGVLLAVMLGKQKVSFFIMLVIWLFIGPLNTHLFLQYFRQIEAESLETFFFIGVMNSNNVYTSFLGYDYSAGSLWKMLAWLSALTILIILCHLKFNLSKKERLRNVVIIGISLVLAGTSLSAMTATNSKAFSYADGDRETEYYQTERTLETDLSYEIDYYSIDFDDVITAEIGLKSLHTSTPSFQLYHAYLVQEVRDQSGKSLSFSQKGDHVQVSTGETDSLTFVYKLVDTYAQPILHGNFLLFSAKGWYPRKASGNVFKYSSENNRLRANHFHHEVVPFTLRSKEELFTNLNQAGSSSYEGFSDGLAVLKGNYLRSHTGEYQIVYPADWNETQHQFEDFIESMKLVHHQLQAITGMDISAIPNQLLLLSGHGETHIQTDLLVYYTDSLYPIDTLYTQYILPEKMIEGFVSTSLSPTAKERENLFEWVDLASLAIADRLGLSQGMFGPSYSSLRSLSLSEDEIKLANDVYVTFFSLTEDDQNDFLKTWLKEIEGIGNDWSKISSLLEGVTEHESGN